MSMMFIFSFSLSSIRLLQFFYCYCEFFEHVQPLWAREWVDVDDSWKKIISNWSRFVSTETIAWTNSWGVFTQTAFTLSAITSCCWWISLISNLLAKTRYYIWLFSVKCQETAEASKCMSTLKKTTSAIEMELSGALRGKLKRIERLTQVVYKNFL